MKKPQDFLIHIVEDDPQALKFMTDVVSKLGFQILESKDSQEVLEKLKDNSPDLFLMDIMLPQTSGLDLIKEIKKIDKHTNTPIIMTTALDDKEYIKEAVAVGANAYVTKPISLNRLRNKIFTLLEIEE